MASLLLLRRAFITTTSDRGEPGVERGVGEEGEVASPLSTAWAGEAGGVTSPVLPSTEVSWLLHMLQVWEGVGGASSSSLLLHLKSKAESIYTIYTWAPFRVKVRIVD